MAFTCYRVLNKSVFLRQFSSLAAERKRNIKDKEVEVTTYRSALDAQVDINHSFVELIYDLDIEPSYGV